MNKFNKILANKVLAVVALFAMASTANALPLVSGTMEMTGGFHAIDSRGNPVSAENATGVDFDFFGFDMFRVTTATDDFSGLVGQVGNITDFQFDPFVAPIADFWSIDIFSFELQDVSRGFTNDPDSFLVLNGEGVVSATGFEDTFASWSFTGDTSGSGIFSWSASSTQVTNVPEPGVLALMAIGLIGISTGRRLQARQVSVTK